MTENNLLFLAKRYFSLLLPVLNKCLTSPSEANSAITALKEELTSKSRDLDVIRDCLVDLRGQVSRTNYNDVRILLLPVSISLIPMIDRQMKAKENRARLGFIMIVQRSNCLELYNISINILLTLDWSVVILLGEMC
jgi:hypothetical protein